MHGIGPIAKPARSDALENCIELLFAHEKRIVLHAHGLMRILKIQGCAVVERHSPERTEACGRVAAQDLREPGCRRFRIACGYNGVIELNGHDLPSSSASLV